MNDIEAVKNETLPIPIQAKAIIVRDQPSLEAANRIFITIKALRKKIAETMDPVIAAAHNAHKVALSKKAELEAPLIEGEKWLNGQVTAYDQVQEKKRREEEEAARQKAIKEEMERRKAEEEARIAQAAELEAAGAQEEAQALVDEVIEDIGKPVDVYVPPPETQRVKLDGASIRETWSATVTDLRLLCRAVAEGKAPLAYIEANMTALNAQARSLKGELNIAGVKAVKSQSMSATGRRAA